jgi:hypothetical protein
MGNQPTERDQDPRFYWKTAGVATVVVAVIGLVGVVIQTIYQGSSGSDPPSTTTSTSSATIIQPPGTATTSQTESSISGDQGFSPFTEGSKDLPKQLVGTWRGRITQIDQRPKAEESELILRLHPVPGGTIVGSSDYLDFGCVYALRIKEVLSDHVILTEKLTRGGCTAEDDLIIRLLDRARIFVTYEIPQESRKAEGTLRRTTE